MALSTVLATDNSRVSYAADFLSKKEADEVFAYLQTLPFRKTEISMFGKKVVVKRRTYAFATKEKYARYRYSGTENRAKVPMPGPIKKLQKKIKKAYGFKTNYVFLNEYPDATSGIGAHADDEPGIEAGSDIIGLSFGRSAPFVFHPKKGGKKAGQQVLTHGSVAVMSGQCQNEFKHSIPAEKKPISSKYPPADVGLSEPTNIRFSLTFRKNVAAK